MHSGCLEKESAMATEICGKCAIKEATPRLVIPLDDSGPLSYLWQCEHCGLIPTTAVLILPELGLLLPDILLNNPDGRGEPHFMLLGEEQLDLPPSNLTASPERKGYRSTATLIERYYGEADSPQENGNTAPDERYS